MEIEASFDDELAAKKLYTDRLERCLPVARKVIHILANHIDLVEMGENDQVEKTINPAASMVLQLFLDENVRWADKGFILNLANQAFATLNDKLALSFDLSWDKAISSTFDGKEALDITFQDVDAKLKIAAAKEE